MVQIILGLITLINMFPKLFKRSTKGAVQQWQIFVDGDSFYTEAGQVGGAITRSLPTFTKPKNSGKKNATTAEEQAEVEAQAKFEKKLKENYYENINEINQRKFIQPILAHPYKNRKSPIPFPAIVNIKYNGYAALTNKEGAFTRKGEQYFNVKHIVGELTATFQKYPDLVLHGEFDDPNDQKRLNRLSELIAVTRKEKDLTPELITGSREITRFSIYDGYFEGKESEPYIDRLDKITDIISKANLQYCSVIPYWIVNSEEEIFDFANKKIKEGYEGAIVRIIDMPYEHKRSMNLLKIKGMEDSEFEVEDILEGEGNWAGCAKKFVCKLEDEYITEERKTFKVNLDGSQKNARDILTNKQNYIGKRITARFPQRSEFGVPQHAYTNGIVRWD